MSKVAKSLLGNSRFFYYFVSDFMQKSSIPFELGAAFMCSVHADIMSNSVKYRRNLIDPPHGPPTLLLSLLTSSSLPPWLAPRRHRGTSWLAASQRDKVGPLTQPTPFPSLHVLCSFTRAFTDSSVAGEEQWGAATVQTRRCTQPSPFYLCLPHPMLPAA